MSEASGRGPRGAGFALILGSVVLSPWPYGCADDRARFALSALLLLAASLWCMGRGLGGSGLPALTKPLLGLPLLAALQLILGTSAAPAWTAEALLLLLALLATLLVASEEAREHAAARWLAAAVLTACAAQAAFGAWQWSTSPARIYGRATPVVTAPFGSYVNHNHFAGLVEMGALLAAGLCAGLARRGERRLSRAVLAGGLTLGLTAAHLASRSRGGLVALLSGFALLSLLAATRGSGARRTATAFTALGVVALCFGALAIPAGTRQHLATVLAGPADSSASYRLDTAAATLRTWGSAPLLGSGLGAFADAVPTFKRAHGNVRTTHAESDALELAAEGGLLGLGLAGALAVAVGRRLGERLERGRDPVRDGLTLGAAAGVAALLVHSMFDFNLRLPANALAFVVLAALAAAPHSASAALGGRRVALCAGALLALAAAGTAWRAHGAMLLARALEAPQSRRLAAFDAVVRKHPYVAEAFRERAHAWQRLASGQPGARLARAARDLERTLRIRPCWAEARADLAWTRFAAGDPAAAARDFAQATALDPTHRGIALARAEFLGRSQGAEAAQGEIRRLREADSSWNETEARRALQRWQEPRP